MITTSIRLTASTQKVGDLRDVLLTVLGPTQAMPECISCRLYQETGKPNSWLLHEEWESEEGMIRHVKSKTYRSIFEAMELASEAPDVKILSIDKIDGFELIERIRESS